MLIRCLLDARDQPRLRWPGGESRCAIGHGGFVLHKREGDGGTPIGRFPLRRVLYRADRLEMPTTALPVAALDRHDGWCDDPGDPAYNRPVRLPHPARHEALWRADGLYDVIVVLGHNDDPPQPPLGSAIFLHVAAPDFSPTEGCIALPLARLLNVLACCGMGAELAVTLPARVNRSGA